MSHNIQAVSNAIRSELRWPSVVKSRIHSFSTDLCAEYWGSVMGRKTRVPRAQTQPKIVLRRQLNAIFAMWYKVSPRVCWLIDFFIAQAWANGFFWLRWRLNRRSGDFAIGNNVVSKFRFRQYIYFDEQTACTLSLWCVESTYFLHISQAIVVFKGPFQ